MADSGDQEDEKYRRLLSSCHELRVAFQNHLLVLTEDLQSVGLIADDNKREISDSVESPPVKAGRLLNILTDKVKICRENYRLFIEVLKRRNRGSDYKDILRILREDGDSTGDTGHSDMKSRKPSGVQSELSPTMSDEEFFSFLSGEGLPESDCNILRDNHIKAKSFIHHLTESDIDSDEFGQFTKIGKRILKQLLQQGSNLVGASKVQQGSDSVVPLSGTESKEKSSTSNGSNSGRRIEIGSGSIRGDLFGKRRDYAYDVPDGAIHVSLDVQDKCDAQINIGSGNGDVTLKWDKAAKKAHVHAWVNGAIGRNHFEWSVYAWL